MPRPVVSDVTERLFGSLGPWARADGEDTGWALLNLCEGFIGQMQPILAIVEDDDAGNPGWSAVMDADRAPADWLPWLAQFVGVRLIAGLTEEAMRLRIKSTDGFKRGTPDAIRAAARQFLIGPDGTPDTATVDLIERHGSAYRITVTVHESEVPPGTDISQVYAAVLEQKPAGIILNPISVVGGDDYLTLRDENASYLAVRGRYTDYEDVETPLTP